MVSVITSSAFRARGIAWRSLWVVVDRKRDAGNLDEGTRGQLLRLLLLGAYDAAQCLVRGGERNVVREVCAVQLGKRPPLRARPASSTPLAGSPRR